MARDWPPRKRARGDDLGDDGLMAEVDAVEVADRGDDGAFWERNFFEFAKDLHASGAMSKGSWRVS
jgi:hypothetical protein